MSNPWYTIFGPQDWDGVIINTGNKKIDGRYYNIIGDKNVQLSASGIMWLVGGSGIQLISQGFVDVSGLRAKTLQFETTQKINDHGQPIDTYDGPNGHLVYKAGPNTLAAMDGSTPIKYDNSTGKLTMPNSAFGPLHVASGNGSVANHEIKSFPFIKYIEPIISAEDANIATPPQVIINSDINFNSGIYIAPYYEGYKGSILTHMGSGSPAAWQPAQYLKADGVLWNRFPKRPVKIENDRITFYKNRPVWAQDWQNSPTLDILAQEFGTGFDTIAITRNDTQETFYVKLAAEIRYGADETDIDTVTPLSELFIAKNLVIDPETGDNNQGSFEAKFCTPLISPSGGGEDTTPVTFLSNGYAYSVTKGGYMDMQLGRPAKDKFNCVRADVNSSPYRLKPSTMNSLSIRPNVHTAFNMLGENIDFVIYGRHKTKYGNYETSVFGLDSGNLPSGLTPAFRVIANIPNAASGNPSSGVYFTKYLDRARVSPTGYNFDTKSKILINTNSPYIVSSLPSGTGLQGVIATTGYISTYADLTVNATLYSQNIISDNIYLRPIPPLNNNGTYIANALLTIDRSGKIVSRLPKKNPVAPAAPTNVMLDPGHTNGIGNSEISLVWTAPINNGNSDIINYIIQFSTNNGTSWTEIPNNLYSVDRASSATTYATIKGLSPLTSYTFRVAAQNSVGVGAYSSSSDVIVAGSSVPKAPYNLVQFREFDSSDYSDIILNWEDSQSGLDNILGYTIEESSDNGHTWQYYNLPSTLITQTSERISGTESRIDYYYRVSAWNSYGQSAFSYIYSSGNYVPDPVLLQDQQNIDVLSNWDFGSILFTGVCPT